MKKRVYIPVILLLICFSMLLLSPGVLAQDELKEQTSPLSVSLGTLRTDAYTSALNFLIEYTKNLPEIFIMNPPDTSGSSGWLLDITPDFKIETGENDAFNGVIAKLSGNYIKFYLIDIAGVKTPDLDRLLHAVPISMGFEADSGFNNISALAEIGYVPFYLKESNTNLKLGLNPKVGIYLQAGYKFDSKDKNQTGGAVDESKESPKSALFRLKGNFNADFALIPFKGNNIGFSILPKATGWYDIANTTSYYSFELVARVILKKGKYYDILKYQKGSGEPNFNTGEQFGTGITIQF